jgi:hypothetical protein
MKKGLLVILVVLCAVFLTGQGCQIYAGENLDLAAQCIQYDYTACSDDGFVIECEAPILDSNSLWDVTVTSEVCDQSAYVSVPIVSVPVTSFVVPDSVCGTVNEYVCATFEGVDYLVGCNNGFAATQLACSAGYICNQLAAPPCVQGSGDFDLEILSVIPSLAADGTSFNFYITVRNNGLDDLFGFPVFFELTDSSGVSQTAITSYGSTFASGEINTLPTTTFDFTAAVAAYNSGSPETYDLTVTLDSDSVITETDESNNELTETFTADLSYFETYSDVPPVDLNVAIEYLGPFPDKPGTFVLADEVYTNYEMDITVSNAGFLNYVPPFTGPHFNLRYNSIIFFQSETPSVPAGDSIVLSFANDNDYDVTLSPHSVFLTMSWLDVLDDTVNTNYDPLVVDFFYNLDNSATWLSGTFDLPYPDCVDYDGGNDWGTAPIVSYVVDNGVQVPDVCNPTNPTTALNEQYCSGNSATYAYYNCMTSPYSACSAGACV